MSVRYLNSTGTQALIDEVKRRLATKASAESVATLNEALHSVAASVPTKTSELTNDAEFITLSELTDNFVTKAELQSVANVVSQNQSAINVLNGDEYTEGSVDWKIAHALDGVGGVISEQEIRSLFV